MAIIAIPAGLRLAGMKWTQPPAYQVNRSELTGATRTVQLGPAERWFATGRLVPRTLDEMVTLRGFLAQMKRPDSFARLSMVERLQVTIPGRPTDCQVNGGGQLGYSLNLKGLAPGVTNLVAGQIIMVVIPGDFWQPIVLGANLVADGAGNGTATLTTPLRKSPADNDGVALSNPVCTVRMRDPLAWEATPGTIYQPGDFVAEEGF